MKEGMDSLIERFTDQMTEALQLAEKIRLKEMTTDFQSILLVGMGGSGIGANFVASWVASSCPLPITINKDYTIPAFVDEKTFAIVSSYSGHTEETLSAFEALQKANAHIVVITSGGSLREQALAGGYDCVQVPEGWPAPRACLGYSIVFQLAVMERAGFCNSDILQQLSQANEGLIHYQGEIKNEAARIARVLNRKSIILYGEQKLKPVLIRWRQQLNENTKLLCSHHVIPELNHNELVGWSDKKDHTAVIILRDLAENKRNAVRLNITKGILADLADEVIELNGRGKTPISRALYLVHLGDWISWYLAELRGVDAMEIKAINYLKNKLAEIKY